MMLLCMHIECHSYVLTARIGVLQRQELINAGRSVTFGKAVDNFCGARFSHDICTTGNGAIIQEVLLAFSHDRRVRCYLSRYLAGSPGKDIGIGGSIDVEEYLRHGRHLNCLRVDRAIDIF